MNNIEVVNLLKEGFKDLGEKLKTQGQTLSSHGESLKKISDQQDQLGEEVKLVKDDLTNQKANVDQNTLFFLLKQKNTLQYISKIISVNLVLFPNYLQLLH